MSAAEAAGGPSTSTSSDPVVVWSSADASRSRSLSTAGRHRSDSASTRGRSRAGTKRHGANTSKQKGQSGGVNSGPPNKKKRVMYDFKINLWDRTDGEKKPISLSNWRIMNVLLCEAAAKKLRADGPPRGGIGQKHWQEHSDGTRKTSELPDSERIGHVVIRFSTMEAQEWFQPLADNVLGTTQDGTVIELSTEVEVKDGKARYVLSLPAADFTAFGDTKKEREDTITTSILAAMEELSDDGDDDAERCQIYSSFLFQDKPREDMWKIGVKFPTLLETKMDSILRGEKFGILPTAIASVRVLKKQNSTTVEEEISQALKKAEIGGDPTGLNPQSKGSRAASTESTKRARSGSSGRGDNASKKKADGPTPDKK